MIRSMHRTVSARLTFAIIIAPLVFCWFTLRQGYSATARAVSIGYAAAMSLLTIVVFGGLVLYAHSQYQEMKRTAVTAGPDAPRVTVAAADLIAAYAADPENAKATYAGRIVMVHGTVFRTTRGRVATVKFRADRSIALDAMLAPGQDASRLPSAGEETALACSTIMTMHPIPGGPTIPILSGCVPVEGDSAPTGGVTTWS